MDDFNPNCPNYASNVQPPPLPMNGGNTFEIANYLSFIQGNIVEFWLLYLQQQKYYTNIFSIVGDEAFERVAPLFFTTMWNYGSCVVKKMGDRYAILTLTEKTTHIDGTFWKGTGIITYNINDTSIYEESTRTQYKLDDKGACFCKWNDYSFPAIFFLHKWLMTTTNILGAINSSIKMINSKVAYKTNQPSSEVVRRNVWRLMNPWNFISIMSKKMSRGKNESTDEIVKYADGEPDSPLKAIEALERFQGWFGSQLGRRENTTFKKERNVSNEVELEESNFNIIEWEIYKYLKIFVDDMNKLYSLNLKIVYNIKNDEEEKGEEGKDVGAK